MMKNIKNQVGGEVYMPSPRVGVSRGVPRNMIFFKIIQNMSCDPLLEAQFDTEHEYRT